MNLLHIYWEYWCLAFIRILLVFVPQTGYIHPDEYFQSVEVLAGRILNVEAKQPWEFNVTFPIRSMAIPYFTIGASLKMLKNVNYFAREYLNSTVFTPYLMIVSPRFLMCILSFLIDYSLYKTCVTNNEKYKSRLVILATSYIALVYTTRTFSNTFELILFAMLLYYVAESLTFSNTVMKKREYINLRYSKATATVDKVKWNKLRSFLKSDSLHNCAIISTTTVLGFFNRPTFLAFAVAPVFFWLYRGIGCKSVTSLHFHLRTLVFIICLIPSLVLLILIDSFYYGYISWGEIGMFDVSINSFVFTPLNFIKYNIDSKNLAEHGLHSRYLHVLVNIPLLFNVLGVCGIVGIVTNVHRFFKCKYHLLPTVRSIKGLMTLSMIIPVAVLSIFPHQEPRFLIPIIVPLVYLHASNIFAEQDNVVMNIQEVKPAKTGKLSHHSLRNYLFSLWLLANVILTVFYGFVHQGGVFPVVSHLSALKRSMPSTAFHVVTSHVYSVPESFFVQKQTDRVYVRNNTKFMASKQVFLYEEGSNDLEIVLKKIQSVVNKQQAKSKYKMFLVIPSSLKHHLEFLLKNTEFKNVNMKVARTFYPHLSTEAFPDFSEYCLDVFPYYKCENDKILSVYEYVLKINELIGLDLYEVKIL